MSNSQIVNLPFKYSVGLQLSKASDSTVNVVAGQCRDKNNVYDIVIASALVIDAEIVGANGIDTGALANSTWYAVHAIGDSTNYNNGATLLSTSATDPVMPAGYDVSRRIGWVKTDGTADILEFSQYGEGSNRTYFWDAIVEVLSAGASATFAAIDCSAGVPSTSNQAYVNCNLGVTSIGNVAEFRKTGSTSTALQAVSNGVTGADARASLLIEVNDSQSTDYKLSEATDSLDVYIVGYVDVI